MYIQGIFQIFTSQKKYLEVFIYSNCSKVYPWDTTFHLIKSVAVNNVNDFRPTFDRSYISIKMVCIKVPPVDQKP